MTRTQCLSFFNFYHRLKYHCYNLCIVLQRKVIFSGIQRSLIGPTDRSIRETFCYFHFPRSRGLRLSKKLRKKTFHWPQKQKRKSTREARALPLVEENKQKTFEFRCQTRVSPVTYRESLLSQKKKHYVWNTLTWRRSLFISYSSSTASGTREKARNKDRWFKTTYQVKFSQN